MVQRICEYHALFRPAEQPPVLERRNCCDACAAAWEEEARMSRAVRRVAEVAA